ncbi:MAG: ABC transporter substrate-binding protein [Spirochaetales bacterium]|uniref:ABC transporter substrate-binding protein n=1 Tax=Candidatus Thalassospirochaeta sargassi TaxID=3119039 RepID=A0AAJ1MLQ7_9SPIO|nr:ABC transporter substrate-binding protein [Spirochaetales bacterium]
MKFFAKLSLVAVLICMTAMVFAAGQQEAAGPAGEKPYEIAVIIKATDSDFWQYLLVGALNYEVENPDLVNVTTYGPPSEADIAQQVTILEDVISTNPDGIVIASTSSDATVPALEMAYDKGIAIITVDNKVNTDKVHSFLATDNLVGGAMAAEKMVEYMKAEGIALKGKVGIVSAMAGIQVLTDRDGGFTARLNELAPDVEVLEPRYIDNDIVKALSATEDLITTYGDELIGIFADNNHSADGAARAIGEQKLQNKIILTGYDSDPEEVAAIKAGVLRAIMVQDPYGMGYKGVDSAVKVIEGGSLPEFVNTGVVAVTKENVNDSDVQGVLDPYSMKKY